MQPPSEAWPGCQEARFFTHTGAAGCCDTKLVKSCGHSGVTSPQPCTPGSNRTETTQANCHIGQHLQRNQRNTISAIRQRRCATTGETVTPCHTSIFLRQSLAALRKWACPSPLLIHHYRWIWVSTQWEEVGPIRWLMISTSSKAFTCRTLPSRPGKWIYSCDLSHHEPSVSVTTSWMVVVL